MKIEHLVLVTLFIGWAALASAQSLDNYDDYSFYRVSSVPVFTINDTLASPWVGGMNSVRFFNLDLNLDGVDDLLAFEKQGNRILPFIRRDDQLVFAPKYAQAFPKLHDWIILKDFNNDGKPDIFTYGLAGISVYQNISEDSLAFRLVTDQLQAFYYNGYVNIYASPDDYLVVDDIDNDGHLDILNFWVLGKYVHHLRNYSNDPNVFDFHLESECWGHFEEATDNNIITLFSDCSSKSGDDGDTRHTGSSMLLHDFTGNGLPDLLLGDVDSPNLILLHNGGTLAEARMTAQDTAFPVNAPVLLYSMPAPSLVSLPGQQHPTLIASPSDPSLTKSQDLNSVWQYDYNSDLQQYTLTSTSFLQEKMIDVGSGCYPVLYDWDNDELTDLFIANYGSFDSASVINGFLNSSFSSSIHYFKNVGTANSPAFQLISSDFGALKELNYQALYPTFGDFDGDGLTDMLCGQKDGTLLLVPHARLTSGQGNIVNNYLSIDVGAYSTPTFFDLDNDGHNDLIIGNQRGLLSYYRNISTSGPATFEHITDTLGQVDVRDNDISYFGYSVPCFLRDATHGTTLVCGTEKGIVQYYNDVDQHLTDNVFTPSPIFESDSISEAPNGTLIGDGKRLGVAFGHLDGDEYPELLVGNWAGGLAYYKGRAPIHSGTGLHELAAERCTIYPNPTTGPLHIEIAKGTIESLVVYDLFGRIILQTTASNIDLSSLPNGIYIIEINNAIHQKVVKHL